MNCLKNEFEQKLQSHFLLSNQGVPFQLSEEATHFAQGAIFVPIFLHGFPPNLQIYLKDLCRGADWPNNFVFVFVPPTQEPFLPLSVAQVMSPIWKISKGYIEHDNMSR